MNDKVQSVYPVIVGFHIKRSELNRNERLCCCTGGCNEVAAVDIVGIIVAQGANMIGHDAGRGGVRHLTGACRRYSPHS